MSTLPSDERSQVLDAATTPRAGELLWRLICPWCHGKVPAQFFLHDASIYLARHAYESHLFELMFLEDQLRAYKREQS